MTRIAIIPARSGSVRIPNKNIRPFFGKPIIAYSIKAAQDSGLFDVILVSTDDMQIADIALEHGAEVMLRAPDDGTRGTQEVAKEVIDAMDIVGMCGVVYATAPMLTGRTLCDAFELWQKVNAPYVVPVGHWLSDPGQFYIGWSWAFKTGVSLIRSQLFQIDPRTAIDINTEADWLEAERMYAELHQGENHDR